MQLKLQIPNPKFQRNRKTGSSIAQRPCAEHGFWGFPFRVCQFLWSLGFVIWSLGFVSFCLCGERDADEFQVKRQEVFEFAEKPTVTREGDQVTIRFESKGYCDVTVAVEDTQGKIIRHLACGVLGPKAPPPLQQNSLKQILIWDGKNDQGRYADDKDAVSIRVSLGLQPVFERNLFWEPKRRHGREAPLFQVAPEGVYVYDGGNGLDFVKLYRHDGTYLRTLYPFPADAIARVKGIQRMTYPQDGESLPVKPTFLQQTFLTCGNLYGYEYPKKYAVDAAQADGDCHYAMYGNASSILAVAGGRIALGKTYLFRFATDGTSGGMEAEGPCCAIITGARGNGAQGKKMAVAPRSAALSPDGKTLYLTGYNFCHYGKATRDIVTSGDWQTHHCVMKMALDGEEAPTLFAGSSAGVSPASGSSAGVSPASGRRDAGGTFGTDNKSFRVPASVAVDRAGRVYVADFMNDRVQVFAPDGSYLKSLASPRPSIVSLDGKTGDIYVFSAIVHNRFLAQKEEKIAPQLTVFGPFEPPVPAGETPALQKKVSCPLPEGFGSGQVTYLYSGMGFPLSAAVDGYTTPPTIWLANEWQRENVLSRGKISYHNISLFTLEDGKLKRIHAFADDVAQSVKRAEPARYARPRLYANPKTGKVYVGEGEAFDYKSFKTLLELDPDTGAINLCPIPFDAEDMCFDHNGYVYLRTVAVVARYEFETWREIPWDYGEARKGVCTSASSDRKEANVISGLILPADGGWHHGGLAVSLRGHIAVACGLNVEPPKERYETGEHAQAGLAYSPRMYPGRAVAGRGGAPLIHIWDERGKVVADDAVPGISGNTYGIGLDADNALYMMLNSTRVLDGKTYPNKLSGTLVKAMPGKARFLSDKGALALPEGERPKRPPDLVGAGLGVAWAEGVEWLYGGVGYDGKNAGVGCGCWNARAAFDYFGRSFGPELHRYRIAVLDRNGNLILRLGRYGNGDSATGETPVVRTTTGPVVGADEVGMVHGAYLATHTDRRLFIADPASDRIFSVKLNYHATEKVALKSVSDRAGK